MLFQILDEKRSCPLVYVDGRLTDKSLPKDKALSTWSYGAFLDEHDVQYAQFYCGGKSLDEACPDWLVDEWTLVRNKLKAFYRSVKEARLDLTELCFYDLVPEQFLLDFCAIKNKITQHIFNTCEKPANYELLTGLRATTHKIADQRLNLDFRALSSRMHEYKVRQFIKKVHACAPFVRYNIFGSKTGRLTTMKGTFPILTMDKSYRKIIKPQNDWFVELDFNAAELRVLLGLLGKDQPEQDLHTWNLSNVFKDGSTREEAKKRVFAWLYNPASRDELLNRAYDRDAVIGKHYDGSHVTTVFGRKIEADAYHALNYTIQSTAADLFCMQMLKVDAALEGKESRIAFCIHDSLVLDFSEKDMNILLNLKRVFSETSLGNFMVGAQAGKNFGDMKRLTI